MKQQKQPNINYYLFISSLIVLFAAVCTTLVIETPKELGGIALLLYFILAGLIIVIIYLRLIAKTLIKKNEEK